MASLRVTNNENDAPVDQGNPRPIKNFRAMKENGRVEKRPRYMTGKSATGSTIGSTLARRPALGERRSALADVTNRISVKKSSTAQSLGASAVLGKKTLPAKRAFATHSQGEAPHKASPPVVNALGSLGLTGKSVSKPAKPEEPKREASELDIDSADKRDPTQCWQYAEDITNYHLSIEKQRQPDHAYMTLQSDINSKMRAILVDWLVDVHYKYALLPQTLHIAVLLIDRFLEKAKTIKRQKLQLVGVTAMFVAAKYEEIYPPEAIDFVKITDNAYSRDELFEMERELLAGIEYRVTFPTSYQFMKRFLKAARSKDDRVEHFAHYVIDRSLQEIKLLKHTPSLIAAAAVHIAKTQMRELPAWSPILEHHSSYSEAKLRQCIDDLKEILWNGQSGVGKISKLTAVRRKFSKERFMSVATRPLALGNADGH